jgi:hypothetical protein
MTKTTYIDRVKKGIELYTAMEALTAGEKITIEFGNRGQYTITAFDFNRADGSVDRSYAISDDKLFGKSMNIDSEKSGKSYLYCYTFDLFQNMTIAKLYFEHITIK